MRQFVVSPLFILLACNGIEMPRFDKFFSAILAHPSMTDVPGVPTVPSVPVAGQTGQTGRDTNQRQYEEKLPLPPAEV